MTNLISYKNQDLALLMLRIAVGVIFIYSGYNKLTGIEGTEQFFDKSGIPLPGVMAWVVALVEFFGGIMVLFGAYIQIPALLLMIIMLVAILVVKMEAGFASYRLDLMLLLVNLAFILIGPGNYSVDKKMK